MHVVAHRQAKVADLRIVALLHHILARAHEFDDHQRQIRKAQWVSFVLLGQERFQGFTVGFVRQAGAVFQRHLHDAHPALGRMHHPAQRSLTMCGQKACGATVGHDHEFFDQLARAVLHLLSDVGDAVAFKQSLGLEGFKLQRAFGPAQHAQLLRQLVLQAQLGVHAFDALGRFREFAFAFNPG